MKAMRVRLWGEILAVASVTACGLAFLIATLGTAGSVATKESEPGTVAQPPAAASTYYDGMITDTHCGAKHSAPLAETAADCTRVCVHSNEKFALVDGDTMYVLEGEPAALKRAAGERVRVVGTLNGNTISVTSVVSPIP